MYRHDWHERMKGNDLQVIRIHVISTRRILAREKISVVVNFLSQVIFVFVLFCGMVMHANEVETITSDKKIN